MTSIFCLTMAAIADPENLDDVKKAAIEFWTTVVEMEVALMRDKRSCQGYIKGCIGSLLPLLFEMLLEQLDN